MAKTMRLRAVKKMLRKSNRRWERRLREAEVEWQQTFQALQQVLEEQRQANHRLLIALSRERPQGSLLPPEGSPWDGSWGGLIDDLIIPACDTLFMEHGVPVSPYETKARMALKLPGNRYMRIDLLRVSETVAIPMLVSSTLTLEEVQGHMRQLPEFREFLPQYAHCQLYGAVAGITIPEAVEQFAIAQGLFVIRRTETAVVLANGRDFVPKQW